VSYPGGQQLRPGLSGPCAEHHGPALPRFVATRTGRRFFMDEELERQFLICLQVAVNESGLRRDLPVRWNARANNKATETDRGTIAF